MATYTLAQRRSLVRTFKKVLARLPDTLGNEDDYDGRSPYICDNIERLGIGYKAQSLAKGVVQERINFKFSMEQWLKDKSEQIWREVNDDVVYKNGRKLQAYRKAWLRSLIAEFEA